MYAWRYVECTSAAIQGLKSFTKLYPKHRKEEIQLCISKAVHYIESIQRPDGSWYVFFFIFIIIYYTKILFIFQNSLFISVFKFRKTFIFH